MNHRRIIFTLITITILLGISYFGLKIYIEDHEKKLKAKAQAENILEGIELEPVLVKVDYSKKIADGSPLVFGGAHMPDLEHEDAWEKIKEVGITSIRRDFFLEGEVPGNITLEDYKSNKNDVQNVKNWNQDAINNRNDIFLKSKKYGFKNIAILSYAPSWLTHSNTQFGVPKDWEVYEDIVAKVYKLHREQIDYIEIWNEPTLNDFLDISNSNLTREKAYELIFFHAAQAIKKMDQEMHDGKTIPIGASISHNPVLDSVLTELLKNQDASNNIDFISYHNYEYDEPSWDRYKSILKASNSKITSFFLTEWNLKGKDTQSLAKKSGDLAIPYTSDKLISFLKMGIQGANYYTLVPLNREDYGNDDLSMGFYRWVNGKAELLPQAKSWRLLSKSMGLGNGNSFITESNVDSNFNSIGFENAEKTKGAAIVSNTENIELMEFDLKNTGIIKRAKINIYAASPVADGGKVIETRTVYPENGNLRFRYLLPGNSVLGIKIYEEKEWYDIFEPIIRLDQPKKEISPV